MTAFRLVSSEVKPLTRELAEQFRDLKPSPTERELDQRRLKHLQEKAENELLVTFHWSVARLNNERYRMNGQHSSTMLCGLNGAFPQDLKVHLDEYEVADQVGLASLFRQFDDRKSSRSSADVAGAYQMLFEPLHDVPKATAKLGIDGICWYQRYVEGVPVPKGDDQYGMFQNPEFHAFLRWLGELFSIKTPELKRAPIVAAMHATFMINEATARTFWHEVARGGVEYDENAPSTMLDNWLKSTKENGPPDLRPGNFFQACIYAWNGLRESKSIKSIKWGVDKGFYRVIE